MIDEKVNEQSSVQGNTLTVGTMRNCTTKDPQHT